MAEKVSPGQQDKAAAERRTAEVGAENKAEEQARQAQARAAEKRQGERSAESEDDAAQRRAKLREEMDQSDSASDKVRQAYDDGDADAVGAVSLNPFPAYEDKDLGDLKSAAESRNVEINRDVEKSELVRLIRAKAPEKSAQLDFMTLEDLRSLASEKDVELSDEFVRAHLVTELRAADTGVKNTGDHVL